MIEPAAIGKTVPASSSRITSRLPAVLLSSSVQAAIVLLVILNVIFGSVIWGDSTLFTSSKGVPSITANGALGYEKGTLVQRGRDLGASAWQIEPWLALEKNQYVHEKTWPLWNPYNGFGTPLLANMQSQPFYLPGILSFILFGMKGYDFFLIGRLFCAGFFSFLFLKRFVSKAAAMLGGIAFMLTGYLVIYLNMPELSVSVLLPLLFFACEFFLSRRDVLAFSTLALSVCLILLGGMPEVSFLVLIFGMIYAICRSLQEKQNWNELLRLGLAFAPAYAIGFCLAAPALLPFIEYIPNSSNVHDAKLVPTIVGLQHDHKFLISSLTYLLPLAYGDFYHSVVQSLIGSSGTRGYWGIGAAMFAAIGALLPFLKSGSQGVTNEKQLRLLSIFFAIAALFFVFKRFGVPLVNWVGGLPVASMVHFSKYEEPLLGFSVACLAAIGVNALQNGSVKHKQLVPILVITCLGVIAFINFDLSKLAGSQISTDSVVQWSQFAAGILLAVLALAAWLASGRLSRLASACLIVVIAGELFFNFIYPTYGRPGALVSRVNNAYSGAPYVTFLKENTRQQERILGVGGALFPNWSASFSLSDIRALDAMYPRKFLPFVRNFVLSSSAVPDKYHDAYNLSNRFTGVEPEVEKSLLPEGALKSSFHKLCALSSVKFIAKDHDEATATENELPLTVRGTASGATNQNSSRNSQTVSLKTVYNKEATVYEVPDVLPRAVLFSGWEVVESDDQALARLSADDFAWRNKVVVTRTSSPDREGSSLALSKETDSPCLAQSIKDYRSDYVAIDIRADKAGLLMLNDAVYPGWKVYVDGKERVIATVNYMFRGVPIEPSDKLVEFRYQPASFNIGLWVGLGAAVLLIVMLLFRRGQRLC